MARPDKAAAVAELTEQFRGSKAVVLTEYRGLTVAQLKQLRKSLGEHVSYAVVKNTLTKIAAREAGVEGLEASLAGPSAIAFVTGDPVEAAKAAGIDITLSSDIERERWHKFIFLSATSGSTSITRSTMGPILADPDLQGTQLMACGQRRGEGVGIVEAPRGTLFHHYRVDERDQVVMANLIVSTTNNNEPMNRAVTGVAKKVMSGQSTITEGMMNAVEVAIRAFDPCLSCATHALGRMPLWVELLDCEGNLVDRKVKE